MMQSVTSWGRVVKAEQRVHEPAFADGLPALLSADLSSIAYGLGRSYGDACLSNGGSLIRMHRLDRVLSADWEHGVVRAEAGISLDSLLRLCVPKGWFLPVTPATKFACRPRGGTTRCLRYGGRSLPPGANQTRLLGGMYR